MRTNIAPPPTGARRSAVDRSPCKGEAPGSNPGASTCEAISRSQIPFNPAQRAVHTIERQELLESDWRSAQGVRRASFPRPDDGRMHTQPGRKLSYTSSTAVTPHGGWLGSGADEGRAKLRYASGRRMESMIRGSPNWTSCTPLECIPIRVRKSAGLKHLSRQKKRNQQRFPQ